MKILHITPSYKPAWVYGGPTRSLAHLCEAQAAAGWEVEVITTLANGDKELPYTPGIPHENNRVKVVYYRRWTGDHSHFSPSLMWNLLFYVRKYRYVHIHSWWNLVAIPAVVLCWLSGRRPLLSSRGMLSPYTLKSPYKRAFHFLIGQFLLKKTLMHATTIKELNENKAGVPNWQGVMIGNLTSALVTNELTNVNSIKTKKPLQDGETLNLITVSRINPVKGLDILFEALASVTFPWQLNIVGDGESTYVQQLKNRAQDLDVGNNITWHGWVDGQAKTALLQSSDLMIMPSLYENFAHVVLESLAVGTPVLISDQVGLKDYVLENDLGWVCSLEGIYETLKAAWADTAKRERIRVEAPALVRRDFDPQVLVEQYFETYKLLEK